MLAALPLLPPDPLWGLLDSFRADPRPEKIDLVVGVYRDDTGQTPTLTTVRQAERQLAERGQSKAYRSLSGHAGFNAGMARLLLGNDAARLARQHTMQTVGGTGALRLLADFTAVANPEATVWSSDPGYVNHRPLMEAAGLKMALYRWRESDGDLDIAALLDDLVRARRGDIVLLHGCCHNPTGIGMPIEGWAAVSELCARQGLVPLVDMAYQGFGAGLDADAAGLQLLVDRHETVLVAASCSKNMGLYCERTGVASVIGADARQLRPVAGTLERITRSNYSMAPDHGAAVAALLLENQAPWRAELEQMRLRVAQLRVRLADRLAAYAAPQRFDALRRQQGMFSMLPVAPGAMQHLRDAFAIYGTENGRINIAGLRDDQIDRVALALATVSREKQAA